MDAPMNTTDAAAASGATVAASGVVTLIYFAVIILCFVALWKIFVKAGKPGWACIIPFYNSYCMFDIAMGNGWLFLLMFIPIVNIIMSIFAMYKLAQAFGKGIGFTLGLIFLSLIFICILAFGDAEYIGPNNQAV